MGFGDPSYPLSTTLEVPSVPSDSDLYEGMTDAQQFLLYALEDAETLRRLFERDHPDEVVLYDALAAVRRWIGGLDNREELERAASAVAINYLGPSVFAHQSVPCMSTRSSAPPSNRRGLSITSSVRSTTPTWLSRRSTRTKGQARELPQIVVAPRFDLCVH